jgi:hypothetical protein
VEVLMHADTVNLEAHALLRTVGITSPRELEKAVREAWKAGSSAGTEKLKVRLKREGEGANRALVIEVDIALSKSPWRLCQLSRLHAP